MSDGSYQSRSFPWLEFIGVIVGLLLIFGIAAMGAEAGGGNTTTNVNVLSNNRILSPETNVYINSGNAPTTVTGDRNTVTSQGQALCWDAALNTSTSSACGVQP